VVPHHDVARFSVAHLAARRSETRAHDVSPIHDEPNPAFINLHLRQHVRVYASKAAGKWWRGKRREIHSHTYADKAQSTHTCAASAALGNKDRPAR
jgi:hypothetical protein